MNAKSARTGTSRANGRQKDGQTTILSEDRPYPDYDDIEHTLEERLVHRLARLGTIEFDIAALVRKTVSEALRTEGMNAEGLAKVVNHVVLNAMRASEHVGSGLSLTIRGVARGMVLGVSDVNGDIAEASAQTIRSVIGHASVLGSDIGILTRHAVDGMIDGIEAVGGDVTGAAKNALEGAVDEASKISRLAVNTVRQVLIGIVGTRECRAACEIVISPEVASHAKASRTGRQQHRGAEKTTH